MKEFEKRAFNEELSPVYDEFKAKVDEKGKFSFGYNNMYFNVMIPTEGDDDFINQQLRGEKLAAKIQDEGDRERFLQLCREHTAYIHPVIFTSDERKTSALVADECNARLWELYKLGRKHGIKHSDLCG